MDTNRELLPQTCNIRMLCTLLLAPCHIYYFYQYWKIRCKNHLKESLLVTKMIKFCRQTMKKDKVTVTRQLQIPC